MEIREGTQDDIREIVEVLKASLGEDQLALSPEIWKYKHIYNPFGESIVLLAVEDKKIIGVRAFMKWNWQNGEKTLNALRAVDTATHPDHQGKGIFKKLTLKAVDVARDLGNHLVFNTPNDQSRPGYLKMGWEIVDKVKVGIRPTMSFLFSRGKDLEYRKKIKVSDSVLDELCESWNLRLSKEKKIFTPKNRKFLKWRYEDNPLLEYEIFADEKIYIAGYTKERKGLKEFRVSECIYAYNLTNNEIRDIIFKIQKRFGGHFITFSPLLVPLKGTRGLYGPILTINNLNLNQQENCSFSTINNWYNSLGDLELY